MPTGSRPAFRYYGHSTVTLELPTGKVVMIDPWVRGNPSCPPELYEPEIVVSNYEICAWLEDQGIESISAMGTGGSQDVLGCRVTMVRADHSASLEAEGRLIYGGTAAGYVVRMPDGYTFHHAGDTALYGDMRLTAELYAPELGFIPIGDLFTMGPREAAHACKLLDLRQVMPIHYGTFDRLTGTPEAFAKELDKLGVDCEVLPLAPGETL